MDAADSCGLGIMGRLAGSQQLAGQPGRHRERDERGHQHRDRDIKRHGAHVGTHHPRNEEHGSKRDDDRERGQHDRRHDLVHRAHHRIQSPVSSHAEVPLDVLDPRNGIVNKQPQGQDESKERDAVDRVAHQVVAQQRQ